MKKAEDLNIGAKLECGGIQYRVNSTHPEKGIIILRNEKTKKVREFTFDHLNDTIAFGLTTIL